MYAWNYVRHHLPNMFALPYMSTNNARSFCAAKSSGASLQKKIGGMSLDSIYSNSTD